MHEQKNRIKFEFMFKKIKNKIVKVMIEKLELAKDLLESLAARKIGGTGIELNSEEAELAYEVFNDYIVRNDEASVDVELPFDVIQSLGGVS